MEALFVVFKSVAIDWIPDFSLDVLSYIMVHNLVDPQGVISR